MSGSKMPKNFPVASEYGYLIHLLRCAIHGERPEELPEGMSFETVYQYAMKHDVANLAFYGVEQLQRKPEAELYAKWGRRRDLALVRDMNQEFARSEIVTEFETRGVLYKELQGTILKKLYPRTEYRTMSDLDFIVEKSRLTECGEILSDLGYQCTVQGDFEIDGIRKPHIYVELHTDYFASNTDFYNSMGEPFDGREDTEQNRINEFYLYNVLHVAKHYFFGGCGIRRVLDIYFLDRNYGDRIQREYVDGYLERAGVLSFAREFSQLAQDWFGHQEQTEGHATMEHYVLEAGLHGNRENVIGNKMRGMQQGNSFSVGTKIKYIVGRLFPGDKTMLKHYPILQKYRILYPAFWIHRFFRMAFGKKRTTSVLDLKIVLKAKRDDR